MPQEIGVRLGGDNTGFRSMLDDSVNRASRAATEITGSATGKFTNLRNVGAQLVSVFAVSLEKVAELAARSIAGMSEAEEEAYRRAEQLSDRATEANIRNMRLRLSDEQRYQLNLKERERLLAQLESKELGSVEVTRAVYDQLRGMQTVTERVVDAAARQLAIQELQVSLAEKESDIVAYQERQKEQASKKAQEAVDRRIAAADKEYQVYLSSLKAEEKIASLKESIAVAQSAIASGALSEKNTEQLRVQLAEFKNQLFAEEAKIREEIGKIDEKNAQAEFETQKKQADAARTELALHEQRQLILDEIAQSEDEIAEGKAEGLDVTERIRRVEELRGKLKEVEKKANSDNVEIAKLLLKGTANLNAEEKLRLELLQGQTTQKKLDYEIGELVQKQLAGMLNPAEKERLAVLVGQSDEIQKQLAGMAGLNKEVANFISLARSGREADDQSTIALEGALKRAKSQLQVLDRDTSYQTAFAASAKNPLFYTLQMEVQRMENELDARKRVTGYASTYGEDAARYKFGDTLTDKALRDMQDDAARTRTALESIERRMKGSALFRKVA